MFQTPLSKDGSNNEQKEDFPTEDMSSLLSLEKQHLTQNYHQKESVIAEFLPEEKKEIYEDRKSFLKNTILNTKLSQITDQALISKEKVLKPFWNNRTKGISKKLWLPIKTDLENSDLKSLNFISKNFLEQKSWFSTKIKNKRGIRNLLNIFRQPQKCSHQDCMGCVPTQQKKKKEKKKLKSLKIRMILTNEQKKNLKKQFGFFRWYYNFSKDVHENMSEEEFKSVSNIRGNIFATKFRDFCRKFKRNAENEFEFDEKNDKFPRPKKFEELDVHNRIMRGGITNYISGLNSAISNKRAKNIKDFKINRRTKKDKKQILYFEDSQIPSFILKMKGIYKVGRKRFYFKDILKKTKIKNLVIIHDTERNKYTISYPVDIDFELSEDESNIEKQNINSICRNKIISLDPGVRTFQTGYALDLVLEIGSGDSNKIAKKLYEIDKQKSIIKLFGKTKKRKKRLLKAYDKIKNLVDELHWKTCNFLTKNYERILLPSFEISGMVRKGKKLARVVKRLMYSFCYFKFKERMKYMSNKNKCKLYIVEEDYTSKTCGVCGELNNNLGSSKNFKCNKCGICLDRDFNGARNILIKNYKYMNKKI